MREQLTNRLQELETEYQKGKERLSVLEEEMANVKTSLLRISGAIQVLKEELKKDTPAESNGFDNEAELLEEIEKE